MSILRKRDASWPFDRFFEDLFRPGMFKWEGFCPGLDVYEDADSYTVEAEIPGMSDKEVKIEIQGSILTIRGEKKFSEEERRRDYFRTERRFGSFLRQVPLPSYVQADKAKASSKDGVLSISFPKKGDKGEKKTIPISND